MQVLVKLTEPIWRAAGQRQISLQMDGDEATLASIVQRLGDSFPGLAAEFAKGTKHLDASYCMLLNSRIVGFADSGQVAVKNGDTIAILLPMAGG